MSSSANNGNFPAHMPNFDGKDWDRWRMHIRALFGFQKVLEIIKKGFEELGANPTEEQRSRFKENKKKDCKTIFILHQCLDTANFDKISYAKNAKEACDILEKCYSGGTKIKKVKLQTLQKQFEVLQMEEQEKVSNLISRLRSITNQMARCGEKLFDYVVCAIEESKDISALSLEELQGTLEARELRIDERSGGNSGNQALVAYANKRGYQKKKWRKNKFKKPEDKSESSSKGGNSSGGKQKKKREDEACVAQECSSSDSNTVLLLATTNEERSSFSATYEERSSFSATDEERSSFSETILLMATTNEEHSPSQVWFLDIGCSNHMTSHK
uniref:Uncharacterized protein LOC101505480 n=1 Tax=Cicer arietinum TaxID=3827 RepID=A0A1S2XDQ7_CICAR|nr:uncharacterized protein LOC101505480 [Cicer arietinum]